MRTSSAGSPAAVHPHAGNPLTIVSYHYVRPMAQSRYPALKALDAEKFRAQLAYLQRHYTFVQIQDVVSAVEHGLPLPPRPILLTFDDGYRDHFTYAFPCLREVGASGAFYPPTSAVMGHQVLDVNKVQFVLASIGSPEDLIAAIERAIAAADPADDVAPLSYYRDRFWISDRFNPPPVLYCKQLLQHALPDHFRRRLVDQLFRHYVTKHEAEFARELYAGVTDLQEMVDGGMHVGGHGGRHCWLDRLSRDEQRADIEESFRLLDAVGQGRDHRLFTFCYPYGGYNRDTLELLRARGCRMAVTVRAGRAHLERDSLLELPRLDTTDLPTDPGAGPPE